MRKIIYVFISIIVFACFIDVKALEVNSFQELKDAINNNENEIVIKDNFSFNELISIDYEVSIDGENHTLSRTSGYADGLFTITNSGALTINNLKVDGGASEWMMDIENASGDSSGYFRADVINSDNDILANNPVINNSGVLNIKSSTFSNIRNNNTNLDNSGGAIRSSGNLVLNDVTFNHCGTKRDGGAIYLTGGKTIIKDSEFIDNVAGVGNKARSHGGAIYVNGAISIDVDNTNFNDNFAQHNGGAIMLHTNGSDIKVTNSLFKHNMCGNDGSAISLESSVNKHKIEITDSVFEENKGIATTSQSMGTIWLDSWKNDESMPAEFKNLSFRKNLTASGSSFATYGVNSPYCIIDNVESYENIAKSMGNFVFQSGTFLISNANFHDNNSAYGGSIVSLGGDIIVSNTVIKNNTVTKRGGGAIALFGTLTIKDSEITNNHSNEYGGGLAAYSMYASYGSPQLSLENVLVKDNTADIAGGGLSIQDTNNAHSIIAVDDNSKIYNNSATVSADDVLYEHANSTSGANVTLDNISIAELLGIDGWYIDSQNNRFKDTDNPTVFEDYINNDGSIAFYIKAAGINIATYDGNGGTVSIQPVTVKYGQEYIVDDAIPVREGYSFKYWNTKADGTGKNLTAGDSYDGSEGYILYAIYEEIKYTINYDLVGGTNDKIVSVTNPYSKEFNVTSEVPEKVGFKFIEWNTKSDGSGISLSANEVYDRSDGFTLYAIYEETYYTVNYDLQGGTNEKIVSITNPYTKEFNVTSEVPEKKGYKFIEWNTKSDGSGISLEANEVYDRSDGFILYAIYEEIEYTINYDLAGGNNEKIVSVTNPYSKEFNVTSEVPEKEGYRFIEWNTKSDGTGIRIDADEVYDRSDGFTLYAIYEKIEEENVPITGDNINRSIIMLILSSLLFTSCLYLRRKNI